MIIDVERCLDCTCCLSTLKMHCKQVRRRKLKQISWRVIADVWANGGILCIINMAQRSGIWNHELRFHGIHTWACSRMAEAARPLDLEETQHHQWHHCDILVMKQDHWCRELSGLHVLPVNDQDPLWASPTTEAQTNILASHCRHVSYWWDFVLLSKRLNALASENTSWAFMEFIRQHALKWQKQPNRWIWKKHSIMSSIIVTF